MLQFLYLYESTCVTWLANMIKNWQSWSIVWYTTLIEEHFDINNLYTQGEKYIYDKELLTHRGDSDNTFSQMSESPVYARGGYLGIHID